MLAQLSIRDIVLIERLDLAFDAGLSVLTGETGAGKSILLDSLSLALGGRGDGSLVRHGSDKGQVTAVFDDDAPFDREALLARFKADNIDGRVFFWPLSDLAPFESRPGNVVSHRLSARGINLPSYHDLSDADVQRVASHVRRHLEEVR